MPENSQKPSKSKFFFKKSTFTLLFIIIILFSLFLFLGTLNLEKIPFVLNQDEMAFSIGALNLSETGYDLCGNKLPLFPCSALDFPYPFISLSYYFSALFYKIYPPHNIFDIRFFSVLIGTLSGIIFFLLARRILKKHHLIFPVLFSLIYYFSPGVFIFQRYGAPYYILPITLQLIFLALIYEYSLKRNKKLLPLIFLVAGLPLFDYQPFRLYLPLCVLFFILIFQKDIRSKYFIFGFSIFIIFSLLSFWQILTSGWPSHYLTKNSFNFKNILLNISYCYSLNPLYCKMRLPFFPLNQFGLFQSLTIILFAGGIVYLIKNLKNHFSKFLLLCFIIYPLPAILALSAEPTTNRIVNLIPVYFIISIFGLLLILEFKDKLFKKFKTKTVALIILFLILAQSSHFLYVYFYLANKKLATCKSYSQGEDCNFIGLFYYLKDKNQKIYFDPSIVFIKTFIKFFDEIMNWKIKNYSLLTLEKNIEKGSIVVIGRPHISYFLKNKNYKLIKVIKERNTLSSFYIFQKL